MIRSLVFYFVVGIDHIIIGFGFLLLAGIAISTGTLLLCLCRCLLCLNLLVDLGCGSIYCFSQGLHGLFDLIEAVLPDCLPDCRNTFLHFDLVCSIELVAAF